MDVCDYDGGDCLECDDTGFCYIWWSYFASYSTSIDADYFLSKDEFCKGWFIIQTFVSQVAAHYNCTNIIPLIDIDGNGLLNAYEAQTVANIADFSDGVNEFRYFQMNCSLCANTVESYYMPWNWEEIKKYTNQSYWHTSHR